MTNSPIRKNIEGLILDATYPLVFTNNLKADPTVQSLQRMTFRKECLRGLTSVPQPTNCPLIFKTAHEDYYISRLESPWACDEEGSTLETIPINIVNSKDGKLMGLNSDTGAAEVSSDNTLWTFVPVTHHWSVDLARTTYPKLRPRTQPV